MWRVIGTVVGTACLDLRWAFAGLGCKAQGKTHPSNLFMECHRVDYPTSAAMVGRWGRYAI